MRSQAAADRFGVVLSDGAATFITCLLGSCDDLSRVKRRAEVDFAARDRAVAVERARQVVAGYLRVDKAATSLVAALVITAPDAERGTVEAFVDAVAWGASTN